MAKGKIRLVNNRQDIVHFEVIVARNPDLDGEQNRGARPRTTKKDNIILGSTDDRGNTADGVHQPEMLVEAARWAKFVSDKVVGPVIDGMVKAGDIAVYPVA